MLRFSESSDRSVKAQQVVLLLIGAATQKQLLNYDDVSRRIGYKGAGVIGPILDYVHQWCLANNLPPLTTLVVNKATGMPGVGLTSVVNNIPKKWQKVWNYNWLDIVPPTANEWAKIYGEK